MKTLIIILAVLAALLLFLWYEVKNAPLIDVEPTDKEIEELKKFSTDFEEALKENNISKSNK